MFPNFTVTTSSRMSVPHSQPFSPPLSHGSIIHVSGTPTGNRFEVNLKSYQDDVVLHFNPRFDNDAVVLNTAQRGSWGQEERHHLPFQRGVHFHMTITVTHSGFSISVNNSHFCEFRQRLSMHTAQVLEVKGDISLDSAQVTPPGMGGMGYPSTGMGYPSTGMAYPSTGMAYPSTGMGYPSTGMGIPFVQPTISPFPAGGMNINYGYPPTQPMPSAPGFPMGGGGGGSGVPTIHSCNIALGSRIFVRGYIHPNAHRFELNLLQGYSDGDDVAFHFNPRFDQRQIVKNHRRNGQWGSEENQPFPAYLPLTSGANIDLQISCQPDRYIVYMNNQVISEYSHKISPGAVKAIQYKGDITVNSVGQI